MRNIRLTIEYDGTDYAGWQVQDNGRTLQGELEAALASLLREPVRITGSGRTDAGVHALAQVANFRTSSLVPLRGVLHGTNALLPRDITLRRAEVVPADFDSRRSALEKTYQYFVRRADTPSAFARRTSWWVRGAFDLAAAERAAALLEGTHDFGAFRAAGCDAAHSVRTVREVALVPRGDFLEVRVRGNGFLRHMVRIVVGTLVEVGQGRRSAASLTELLETGDRGRAGVTAPPHGLFLAEVRYDVAALESCP
ncbi:MAG: tRNA pseudouridine(38-40) synthase TruA [Deltaproteobacteria bacterium]|nr:tRNA pseudouridine(38-40) synthase TruA [Deltaproteobacteria bacterium]